MGISAELFVDSFGLDDLTCVVCHEVFDNPYFAGCDQQHAFCHDCLKGHFNSIPHSTLAHCPICRGSVHKLKAQQAGFVRRLVEKHKIKCSLGCGWEGQISAKHETNCDLRIVPCANDGCDWDGPSIESREHEEACDYSIVVCARGDCMAELARKDAAKHDSVCKGYRCSFHAVDGCPFLGDAATLKTHLHYCEGIHALLAGTHGDVEAEHDDVRELKKEIVKLNDDKAELEAEVLLLRRGPSLPSPPLELGTGFGFGGYGAAGSGFLASPKRDSEFDDEEELDGDALAEEDAIDHEDDEDDSMADEADGHEDEDKSDGSAENDETFVAVKKHHKITTARLTLPFSSTPQPTSNALSPTPRSSEAHEQSPPLAPRAQSMFPLTKPKARASVSRPLSSASVNAPRPSMRQAEDDLAARRSTIASAAENRRHDRVQPNAVAVGPFKLTQPVVPYSQPTSTPMSFNLTGSYGNKLARKPSQQSLAQPAKRRKAAERASRTESSDSEPSEDEARTWENSGRAVPSFSGSYPKEWDVRERA